MGDVIELRVRVRSLVWLGVAVLAGVVGTLAVTSAWPADAAPGDTDATYVPWPGCRLTDTRPATQVGPRSTKLGADAVMTVEVFGDQGACTGELAIPDDAVGLSTNVTVVDATAQSNVRVYRGDLAAPPLLSNLNVVPGAPPTPNAVDVQLSPDGEIKVYNFSGSVNIVIDVVGYYTPTSLLELASASGTAGPAGPIGPAGPAGARGPAGADGVSTVVVRTEDFVAGNAAVTSEIANCRAGEVATGGGVYWTNPPSSSQYVIGSGPSDDGFVLPGDGTVGADGWAVEVFNASGGPKTATVRVLCIPDGSS